MSDAFPVPVQFPILARRVLLAFLLTFIAARITVYLIMSRDIPDLYLYSGETHVHHLNYGIFMLSAVGAGLLFGPPSFRWRRWAATLYGIGMGLTYDEFGMWLHLGGGYWQRASWDAVGVLAALFALIWISWRLRRLASRHWLTGAVVIVAASVFAVLLVRSFSYAGAQFENRGRLLDQSSPPQ
ncbi:MAG: hypothetical protein V4726_21050 [Verrucomicrobiota bacterium]